MTGFMLLGGLAVFLLAVLGWWAIIYHVQKRAYKRGFDEGRAEGKLEGELWWLEQGDQVQRAREAIWREES